MTYPPGYGGDPHGSDPYQQGGQPPPQQPGQSWWDQPAQQADPTRIAQPVSQPWEAQQQGYPQQQGYQGGYAQQPPYQQPAPPPRPPKSNTGVIVAAILVVVAALVVGVGVIAYASRDKSEPQAADPSTSLVPATSAPETTKPKSTAKSPSSTPRPTQSAGGRLSYTEYGGKDWDFKLDDVQLQATWVDGRDHQDCRPIEKAGKLSGLGCQYAAELVYKAEDGAIMLTQFIMGMSDKTKADAAIGKYTDSDLKLRRGTYIENFATGKWKDASEKEFVVLTVATATNAVDEATVSKYLKYLQADTLGALVFR